MQLVCVYIYMYNQSNQNHLITAASLNDMEQLDISPSKCQASNPNIELMVYIDATMAEY